MSVPAQILCGWAATGTALPDTTPGWAAIGTVIPKGAASGARHIGTRIATVTIIRPRANGGTAALGTATVGTAALGTDRPCCFPSPADAGLETNGPSVAKVDARTRIYRLIGKPSVQRGRSGRRRIDPRRNLAIARAAGTPWPCSARLVKMW